MSKTKHRTVLVILDGWGIGQANESNPIHVVNPANINYLKTNFPGGSLQASGISVGLPWGEEGNSEIGHLTIGAGKTIYQYYPKISLAIKDGSFFKNEVLQKAFVHSRQNNSSVNLVGMLSAGHVHSSFDHLNALLTFAEQEKISKVNLHLFADGRDSLPNSVLELLSRLPQGKIASLSGRFYAMDRNQNWDRTKDVYSVLTGSGPMIELKDLPAHIQKTYDKQLNDEYILPVLIGPASAETAAGSPNNRGIKDGDSVIFFNFRKDRMLQLTESFINKQFDKFPTKKFTNLYVASMTPYDDSFNIPAAFQPDTIESPLGKMLADNNKIQFRIAETQKYPHITYFFNGLREKPFSNEYQVLIPSKMVLRQDEDPIMRALEITNRAVEAIEEESFDFILINYANPDMVAHTGNYEACLTAVKIIDEQIGKLTKAVLEHNAAMLITSDHGNMEKVFNPETGQIETQHDPNPVPIYLVGKEFQVSPRNQIQIYQLETQPVGILADVAPTIVELIGVPRSKEMTGQSLLKFLLY